MNIEYKKKYLKYKNKYMRLNGGVGVLRGGELKVASFIIHEDDGEKYLMPSNFYEGVKLFNTYLKQYITNSTPTSVTGVTPTPPAEKMWITNKYEEDNKKNTLKNYQSAMKKWNTTDAQKTRVSNANSMSADDEAARELKATEIDYAKFTALTLEEQLTIIFNFTQSIVNEAAETGSIEANKGLFVEQVLVYRGKEETNTLVKICGDIYANLHTHNTAGERLEPKHEVYIKYEDKDDTRPWYIFLFKLYKYIEFDNAVPVIDGNLLKVKDPKPPK